MFRLHKIDGLFGTNVVCDCGFTFGKHNIDNGKYLYGCCPIPSFKGKPVWFEHGSGWVYGVYPSLDKLLAFLNSSFR